MKGLLLALRISANDSMRGLKKWTDLFNPFSNGFPPSFAVAGHTPLQLPFQNHPSEKALVDPKSEGILWGVPKRRRSVEKRLARRFGLKEWTWKMLIPKYNLLVCDNCGHHYQAKHLCRNCYEKNVEETNAIRESIETKFGDSPIDKDVIVLYESDKSKGLGVDSSSVNVKNKLIVELPKERPSFFSPNLLQKSTVGLNKKASDVTVTDPIPIVHKTDSN